MKTFTQLFTALIFGLLMGVGTAIAVEDVYPAIGTVDPENAQTVCEAWPEGISAVDARSSGLSWVSFPAEVKPFGMRAYANIDGLDRPLKQIAYAHHEGTLSFYYRTLGDRHYDVYLTLNGLVPGEVEGTDLTGTLVVSRFGLYSEIKISGTCGGDAP